MIWTGYIDRKGYARSTAGQATRVLWRKLIGPIPLDHDLHHRCHNRACVNLDHLEPKPKGRHVAEHHRRFTAEQVREIRALGREGLGVTRIAERFAVKVPVVWKILNGHNYASIV